MSDDLTSIRPSVPTFPLINGELLVFMALFRQEIQKGDAEQPVTFWDLNYVLEGAMERYLNGERL